MEDAVTVFHVYQQLDTVAGFVNTRFYQWCIKCIILPGFDDRHRVPCDLAVGMTLEILCTQGLPQIIGLV